jgi:hypothetical protein
LAKELVRSQRQFENVFGVQANGRQKPIVMVRDMPSRRANDVAIAIFGVR